MVESKNIQKILCLILITLIFTASCKKDEDDDAATVTAADTTAPTIANSSAISVSNIAPTTLTLTWTKASDTVTAEADLQYLVYESTSDNIDTVANIEANGTAIDSYAADITTKNITGLSLSDSHYFNLIVKDQAGNETAYTKICGKQLIGGRVHDCEPLTLTTAVSTLAGTAGTAGTTDGTGTAAYMNIPKGITTDGTSLYVADSGNHTIRKVVISTGEVTTLAGTADSTGDTDGTGTNAKFYEPNRITTDGTNLYVTESRNHTIRKIVISTGEVTTLAGTAGTEGITDGTGTAALFDQPSGIIMDGTNLYVADFDNHSIRKIVISTQEVTTFAGSDNDEKGDADGIGTSARFNGPEGITTDGTNLFVTDQFNHTIRKVVISTGEVTTLAGTAGTSGTTDGTGTAALFNMPYGITTDGINLFVSDVLNHTIRKIVISTGEVTTLAGTAETTGTADGTGTAALFNFPLGVTTDGTSLYVTDGMNHTIRKID